jgi:hypothetical protein
LNLIEVIAAPPPKLVSPLQMYFDLGNFKEELLAREVSDKVGHLGFRTAVIHKKFLWMNSYRVLVGPYEDEDEEKGIERSLRSHGYQPLPYERGSRDFVFSSRLTLYGSRLPTGMLTITWEAFIAKAKVRFVQEGKVITAEGTWMRQARKYTHDEYVYRRNNDGSKTLLEVHFSGLNRVLVFRAPS